MAKTIQSCDLNPVTNYLEHVLLHDIVSQIAWINDKFELITNIVYYSKKELYHNVSWRLR